MVPTWVKPAFANMERVPTKAIVVSIRPEGRPEGSTGYASTAGASREAACCTAPSITDR